MGEHKRTLQVPGNNLTSLAWELGSLKLCLTVVGRGCMPLSTTGLFPTRRPFMCHVCQDNFIYFANVRPDYLWGHFADTGALPRQSLEILLVSLQ